MPSRIVSARHFQRRDVLKYLSWSAAAAAVAAAGPSFGAAIPAAHTLSTMSLDSVSEVDVVVVGGGFAGVTAARECCKAGLRTVVLEARTRLGGRTFYSKFGDEPVELGGQFVHWFQPNVWSEVLYYGLQVRDAPEFDNYMWTSGGKVVAPPRAQAGPTFAAVMAKFNADAEKIFPRPYDEFLNEKLVQTLDGMSALDRIEQLHLPIQERDLLIAVMESLAGAPSKSVSYLDIMKWWALSGNSLWLMGDAVGHYYFQDGTISLINSMMNDAKIPAFIGAPVSKITQREGGAEVLTESGKLLKAKRVIVTAPLNVLKDIHFEPGLSALKMQASQETHAGFASKVEVKTKGPVPSVMALSYEPQVFSTVLSGWATAADNNRLVALGSGVSTVDVHDPEVVQRAIRRFLPTVEVEETLAYDWTLDPYSRGTWCVYRPNMLTRYLHALQAPQGDIYFASADWANGWRGFMDGAIERGRSVGHAVVNSLKRA